MRDEIGDAELLEAIGKADSAAFGILTRRYARKCYGLAYRLLGNREMAEDTVQEVFMKIWTKPFMWQPDRGAKFGTWLYRVVSNASVDTYRRYRSSSGTFYPVSLDEMPIEPAAAEDELTKVHLRRVCDTLRAEIVKLPANQRLAIIFCRMEGKSYAEAADMIGTTPKAVDGYVNRGVRTLKKKMAAVNLNIEEILK